MMHGPRTLTLIIPGLLPPPAAVTENDLPDCRILTRILARADTENCSPDYHQLLFDLFGMTLSGDTDHPVAAVSYFAETGNRPGYCLRADPVHLSASGEGIVLFDNAMITLEAEEAESIAADLQPWLDEINAELHVPHPSRWYLSFREPPQIRTTPLTRVVGRDVSMALPDGADRTRWRQLFNEIQMVLHTARVNEAREKHGRLPVNSLWFWGLGTLPDQGVPGFAACFSDDPFVRGLAAMHDIPAAALPASADELLQRQNQAGHVLVVDERAWQFQCYNNVAGWLGYLEILENEWMQPLEQAAKGGDIDQFDIIVNGIRFSYCPAHRWRFWRRGSLLDIPV